MSNEELSDMNNSKIKNTYIKIKDTFINGIFYRRNGDKRWISSPRFEWKTIDRNYHNVTFTRTSHFVHRSHCVFDIKIASKGSVFIGKKIDLCWKDITIDCHLEENMASSYKNGHLYCYFDIKKDDSDN